MFGSFNIGTDYTFTQSEQQNIVVNKSKLDSSYVGVVGVSKRDEADKKIKKPASDILNDSDVSGANASQQSTSMDKTKKGSSNPEIKLLGQDHGEDDNSDYLYNSDGKATSVTNSFDALAAAVGGVGGKVTKDQLISYLQSLTSDPSVSAENAQEVTFIKGLIAQFDTISNDVDYITSFADVKEPQDYKTVTKDQVTPPVDIRV